MNRLLAGVLVLAVVCGLVRSGSGADAASIAEQQEREERSKQLRTDLEDVMTTQALLQKKMQNLADEIKSLRDEKNKTPPDMATREDLKILAEKIQEVDKKREADNEKILSEIQKLAKLPGSGVAEKKPSPPAKAPSSALVPDKGYEYEVQSGDTIDGIVGAYRKAGVKVTREQVLKANPKLNEKRLLVGQKIFIPSP